MTTSDPTPGMDIETPLAEWQRERNCDDITHVKGAGERLATALRTEQSARQAAEVDYEVVIQANIDWQHKHDALQQRIDAALEPHSEREWRPLDGTYLGGTVCRQCRRPWPCAIVRTLTAESKGPDHE